MSKPSPTLLNVRAELDGQDLLLGQLSYDARMRSGAFQWSEEARALGIEWSPINLPLSEQLWVSSMNEVDLLGLPGMVHDCLPDGWGMLLMDRAFGQAGIAPHEISPMLRLAFLANRCWGALRFDPEWGSDIQKEHRIAMDQLSEEASAVMSGDTEQVSRALLVAGGSPHGARPKVMVAVNEDTSRALVGHEDIPEGYRHVLIKFAGSGEDPTAPLFEFCYGEAARALGIETAKATMISAGGQAGLCLDRFDRQDGRRQHVHSMAGMLHITHRIANADWVQVGDILRKLRANDDALVDACRRAVFNAVFCVRDDHTKNIAFMRQGKTDWSLSPAFDLAYSDGPGGYHTTTYAHHTGQNVSHEDIMRLGRSFGVSEDTAHSMIQDAQDARSAMLGTAKQLGVSKAFIRVALKRFREIDKHLKGPRSAGPKGR